MSQRFDISPGGVPVSVEYASIVPGYAHMIVGYSLTSRLNLSYRGPCVRARRTSDNLEADFFVYDETLTSARHGRGHTLDAWRSNAIARVVTLYDQSGREAHATQEDQSLQPVVEGNKIVVKNQDITPYLNVPSDATSRLVNSQESSIVVRARAPYSTLSVWNGDAQSVPLLASTEGEWLWTSGSVRVEASPPTFETLSATVDASGVFLAYHERTSGYSVGRTDDTNLFEAAAGNPAPPTLRISGELQHLYMFDVARWEGVNDEFGFSASNASFTWSNAFVNTETLVVKDRSKTTISLLSAPQPGDGVAYHDEGVSDRIRFVAGEHLWQMQLQTRDGEDSNMEQDAFWSAMALRGPEGDLLLWGQAFMSNDVWMSKRLTVGSTFTLEGDMFAQCNVTIQERLRVFGPCDFRSNVDVTGHFTASNEATFFGPTDLTGDFRVYENNTMFEDVDFVFERGTFNVDALSHARFHSGIYATTPMPSSIPEGGPTREQQCGLFVVSTEDGQAVVGVGQGLFLEGREDHAISINTRGTSCNGPAPRRVLIDTDGRVAIGEVPTVAAMLNVASISNVPELAFQDFDRSQLRHVFRSDHDANTMSVFLGEGDLLSMHLNGSDGVYVPGAITVGQSTRLSTSSCNEFVVSSSNVTITSGPRTGGVHIDNSLFSSSLTLCSSNPASCLLSSHNLRFSCGGASNPHSSAMVIASSNNYIGIGLSNSILPQYALHVHGVIFSDQDVRTLSDERVKFDLRSIDNALDRVRGLGGYTFSLSNALNALNASDASNASNGRSTGLIAQEVARVLPEAVRQDETSGLLSIAYGNLVGLLVEAIKQLDAEVTILKHKSSA